MKFRIIKRKEVVGNNYKYAFQVMIGDIWQFVDLHREIGTNSLVPSWYDYVEDCKQAAKNYYYHYYYDKSEEVVEEFEL